MSTFVCLLLVIGYLFACTSSKPNVIFMFADDLGWNDVGYHGYTDTRTPFIDELATKESLILSSNYVQRLCTASRAAFLSGRYPIRYGLQHSVLQNDRPYALTRQVSLLSDEFKSAGYNTHMIGKWHLGHSAWEYTPTYRSFDTFSGFYSGFSSYWKHIYRHHCEDAPSGKTCDGHDLRINEEPATGYDNVYGAYWERDAILSVLQQYAATDHEQEENPFFMYIGWRLSHSPAQAPPQYLSMYPEDQQMTRRAHQAQTSVLDDIVSEVINYMKENNLWHNTLLVFSSDNGGQINFGDNSPLRGYKNMSYDGGIRVPGFVTGGYLSESRRGQVFNSLIHAVDWYPTLLSAAGLDINYALSQRRYATDTNDDISDSEWKQWLSAQHATVPHSYLQNLDGKDMWNAIQFGEIGEDEEREREILLDMDPAHCRKQFCGVIRSGKWKFMYGNNAVRLDKWPDADKWNRAWDTNVKEHAAADYDVMDGIIQCSAQIAESVLSSDELCWASPHGCLYDIEQDPCEYSNVAVDNLDVVKHLKKRLKYYWDSQVAYIYDDDADPLPADLYAPYNFDGFWSSFMKIEDEQWEQSILLDVQSKQDQIVDERLNMRSGGLVRNQNPILFDRYLWYLCWATVGLFLLLCLWIARKIFMQRKIEKHLDSVPVTFPRETTPLITIK